MATGPLVGKHGHVVVHHAGGVIYPCLVVWHDIFSDRVCVCVMTDVLPAPLRCYVYRQASNPDLRLFE